MPPQAPPKPPPSPPAKPSANGPPPAPSASKPTKTFTTSSGVRREAHRVVVYGTGGIGKTTLLSLVRKLGLRVLFIDVESGSDDLDVERLDGIETFEDLRAALQLSQPHWKDVDVVALDSLTKAQEMAEQWVVQNVKHESGKSVKSIEGFGYGKGYRHLYDAMKLLKASLYSHYRAGRHVLCTAHDCVTKAPNPEGEEWLRYEPDLYTSNEGKNSVRNDIKNWADHLFFLKYDVAVSDGKGIGAGTRTIYVSETPMYWAKSRDLRDSIPFENDEDASLWEALLKPKGV